MSAAVVLVLVFAMALVIPLVLWAAIGRETADPTVIDRAEAERIAKERGGRGSSRSTAPSEGTSCDDRRDEFGWGGRRSTAEETDDGENERNDRRGL